MSTELMTDYSDSRARYRRLLKLTFLPLIVCFICLFLMTSLNVFRVPLLGTFVGIVDILCFVTFAVSGVRLGRFRCPRCSKYFSRGKRVYRPRGHGPRCRSCGLEPFEHATLPDGHVLSEPRIQHWISEVGIPIFIPQEGRLALKRQDINGPRSLITELGRIAALGSNWAAAALATILVYPDRDGNRELDRAREFVRRPASEGDAYSQYVLAWVELFSGNQDNHVKLLESAARAGFGAALMDLAAAFERERNGVAASMKLLKVAASKGHLVARGRIFLLWMRGRSGWVYIIPGLIGVIINWARVTLKCRQDPWSPHIFCISSRVKAPPIRRHTGQGATVAA